jgi:serine/threonine-protein kinase HipA
MYNDQKAGILTEQFPGKGYRFEYFPEYLREDTPHISVTMPKKNGPYTSEKLFPFFANILPEGALRRVVCRQHHVDENDLFGILCAMDGTDSIGAINVKEVSDEKRQ